MSLFILQTVQKFAEAVGDALMGLKHQLYLQCVWKTSKLLIRSNSKP